MKYLKYNLMMALLLVLASCEVTTVKGNWKSDKYDDGSYAIYRFSDNGRFIIQSMVNDSICSNQTKGTWIVRNDTILYYIHNGGGLRSPIETLSQDIMTIKGKEKYFIMTRIYDNPDDGFSEVLKLKGGFWYWIYQIIIGGIGAVILGGGLYLFYALVKDAIRRIRNLWYKYKNKLEE